MKDSRNLKNAAFLCLSVGFLSLFAGIIDGITFPLMPIMPTSKSNYSVLFFIGCGLLMIIIAIGLLVSIRKHGR